MVSRKFTTPLRICSTPFKTHLTPLRILFTPPKYTFLKIKVGYLDKILYVETNDISK
jgi:hypothetical protein